jgi:Ser/Thr protein kinase RdoA (MazF antagonist)
MEYLEKKIEKEEIKKIIFQEYEIKIIKITQLFSGWDNFTYKIETEEEKNYIIRISKPEKTKDEIEFEINVLNNLKEYFPNQITKIIKTKSNKNSIKIDNRITLIMTFLEGIHITINDDYGKKKNIRIQQVLQMTEFIGKMNRLTEDIKMEKNILNCKWKPDFNTIKESIEKKMIKKFENDLIKIINDDSLLIFQNQFEIEKDLPHSIIHFDLHDENLLYKINNEQIELSGVIDFDTSFFGPQIYDLVSILFCWIDLLEDNNIDFEIIPKIINLYEISRERVLSNFERKYLNPFFIFYGLIHINFFLNNIYHNLQVDESIEFILNYLYIIQNKGNLE